jgi:hypothetical protein
VPIDIDKLPTDDIIKLYPKILTVLKTWYNEIKKSAGLEQDIIC